jgi:uncharacterized protein (DUF2336 family)
MNDATAEASRLLTDALACRGSGEQGRVVREIADLFMKQPASYSTDQVDLFDSIMMKIVDQIDEQVRVYLADRLAADAPRQIARHLASDPAIAVAGPMLAQSPHLDEDFLVESAKTRSQAHLMAISTRKAVGPRVTDVLVDRGNDEVVLTLARNSGAAFSDHGRSLIVERAKDRQDLAHVVWNREDIPRQQVLALFEKVSEAVRHELAADGGRDAEEIDAAVTMARRRLQEKSQESSSAYASARGQIASLQKTGGLSQSHVLSFASQHQFEAVVVAIAQLSQLSAADTERMLLDGNSDRLLIVAKAIGLTWTCVRLILMMHQRPKAAEELEFLRARYQSLSREQAAKGLQFHQLRERARNGPLRAAGKT